MLDVCHCSYIKPTIFFCSDERCTWACIFMRVTQCSQIKILQAIDLLWAFAWQKIMPKHSIECYLTEYVYNGQPLWKTLIFIADLFEMRLIFCCCLCFVHVNIVCFFSIFVFYWIWSCYKLNYRPNWVTELKQTAKLQIPLSTTII